MDKEEISLYALTLLMVLCGVSFIAIVVSEEFSIFAERPLYAAPLVVFIAVLALSSYVLMKKIIPADKDFVSKLSIVMGAIFLLSVFFSLMAHLSEAFIWNEIVITAADYNQNANLNEWAAEFMNFIYVIAISTIGVAIGGALLFLQWNGNGFSKYLLTLLTMAFVYFLKDGIPFGIFLALVFLIALWLPTFLESGKKTRKRKN